MTESPYSSHRPTHRARSAALGLAVGALLLLHWLVAVASTRNKSPTFDEAAHLIAGVSLWKTGDYRLVPEHPPLPHLWAALPILASRFALPHLDDVDWWGSNQWGLGRRFLYECGNDYRAMMIRSRAMIALLSVGLGLAVWWWSRRLFGSVAGLLSLVLYVISPTMLAHARLVTTDMPAALSFLIAVAALWWVLRRVSPLSVLLSAATVAGLFLTKMSAPIVLPVAGVLVLVRLISGRPTAVGWRRTREVRSRLGQLGVWLAVGAADVLIVVLLIWAVYGFRFSGMKHAEPGRDRFFTLIALPAGVSSWDYVLSGLGRTGTIISWARDRKLLPEAYLFGSAFTLHHAQTRWAYLNGQASAHGWWTFFPYCFAVKTPLALLAILLVAGLAIGLRNGSFVDGLYKTAPLWAFFCIYWAVAIASGLNIGHRHLLPIYPVLFILAGSASAWLAARSLAKRLIVPGLVGLFVVSSAMTFPHYLAYFNMLAGGPDQAYKHLVDSSLDWGQDLPGLKNWLDANGVKPPVYLAYFGTALPKPYGIDARMLPSFIGWDPVWTSNLTGGVYCISATMLQQGRLLPECRWTPALEAGYQDLHRRITWATRRLRAHLTTASAALSEDDLKLFHKLRFARLCALLRQRRPDDEVGHSILIYRLTDDDVRRALDGPPAELAEDRADNLRHLADQCLRDKCFASAAIFYEFLFAQPGALAAPELTQATANRASALMALGRDADAIGVLHEGLQHAPNHAGMNNDLAWLLATSRSAELRNGTEALRHAEVALKQTHEQDPSVLDTLAAAYAELGQFDQARRAAAAAMKIAKDKNLSALSQTIAAHLKRYESRQPLRSP